MRERETNLSIPLKSSNHKGRKKEKKVTEKLDRTEATQHAHTHVFSDSFNLP